MPCASLAGGEGGPLFCPPYIVAVENSAMHFLVTPSQVIYLFLILAFKIISLFWVFFFFSRLTCDVSRRDFLSIYPACSLLGCLTSGLIILFFFFFLISFGKFSNTLSSNAASAPVSLCSTWACNYV